MNSVYFDYNATTPLDAGVREAMLPFLNDAWGNPSSVHRAGRRARALLDDARDRGARVLGCKPSELIFTSGGTESANLAVLGAARLLQSRGRHVVTSAIEHHAVLHACRYLERHDGFRVTHLPVDARGLVAPEALKDALTNETVLVSVMAANNEIGTVQRVAELGEICRGAGVVFHTDAVQWFGKQPFANIHQFNADLVSICAHKIYGPKGAGALFIKSPLQPDPILFGGGHENERRAGTENLAGIAGVVAALERFVREPVFDSPEMRRLTERLIQGIDGLPGVQFVGSRERRLPNTVSFVVEGADGIALMAGLDLEGVCASSGSACSAGSLEPSHVVRALGLDDALANALVRFSLGRDSTREEVEYTLGVLPGVIERTRKHSSVGAG